MILITETYDAINHSEQTNNAVNVSEIKQSRDHIPLWSTEKTNSSLSVWILHLIEIEFVVMLYDL